MSRTGPERRALRCEESHVLLMGYIDGELPDDARARLEDHLALCVSCRAEERSYRSLGKFTEDGLEGGGEVDRHEAWETIYSRLERRVGWVLLWIGILVLSAFGLWQFAGSFLFEPDVPIAVRLGAGTLVAGSLMLLVSFLRETLFRHRNERYREVER